MCRRYTTCKTVLILQPVKLVYMFRPLPGYHQANKEILLIKVHSLTNEYTLINNISLLACRLHVSAFTRPSSGQQKNIVN